MWIQNKEDLRDAWELLERNKTHTLWCHGQDSHKKKHSAIVSEHDAVSNSDSEASEATGSKRRKTSDGLKNSRTTSKEKATRVQEIKQMHSRV